MSDETKTAQPTTNAVPEGKAAAESDSWHTEIHGYFRAPVSLGISSRQGPDDPAGPSNTQVSYGPNRVIDSNYYSFAYTRLQEQDWVEVFVHEKKKHVDAAVGWMGYWFQSVGFRNFDAAWAPGVASLALDTDLDVAGYKPNLAVTMGAFWPSFGYFEKYDTYTLGRFRQIGEQLKLTVPATPDLTVTAVHGFGTSRDGSFNPGSPPFYASTIGLDLITYANVKVAYKNTFDVAVHFNTDWTLDPNLVQQTTPGDKSFHEARVAHLSTLGAEGNVRLPYAGHLWISPSFIHVRNGWALASAGTEVMNSLGGVGVATNYLAWANNPTASTGSGSMFNVGVLYENTLSEIQGKSPGTVTPEVTLNLFALFTTANLHLPAGSRLTQDRLTQFKDGVDVTVQALPWLGLMLRYDTVNYDVDHAGYIFAAITPRAIISSHFLSSERIYVQYSRYIYGDNMLLAAKWPWGSALVAGADILQQGPYAGKTPDENVVKFQADVTF